MANRLTVIVLASPVVRHEVTRRTGADAIMLGRTVTKAAASKTSHAADSAALPVLAANNVASSMEEVHAVTSQ
jgi:hypothetical protein